MTRVAADFCVRVREIFSCFDRWSDLVDARLRGVWRVSVCYRLCYKLWSQGRSNMTAVSSGGQDSTSWFWGITTRFAAENADGTVRIVGA
jgi:hypothetical protein